MALSAPEIADLIQRSYDVGCLTGDNLRLSWSLSIIGLEIRVAQVFTSHPYVFIISSRESDTEVWRMKVKFDKATWLYSNSVVFFGSRWIMVEEPVLEGDTERYVMDALMLRMAKELWTPVPF